MLNSYIAISQTSTYSKTLDLDGLSSFIEIPSSTELKFDSDKLKDGIDWLAKEIKKDNSKGENAKFKIREFGANEIAKKYIKLYEKILNET